MPALTETQHMVRAALIGPTPARLASLLRGGPRPTARLAIHQRHHIASLAGALLQKFPAAAWYAGAAFVTGAARAFIERHPPQAPCIAEYGERFPAFLGGLPAAPAGLEALALLDWHLGHVAIAIDKPAITSETLSHIVPDALLDVVFEVQPGLRYMSAALPVDTLMRIFLHESDEAISIASEAIDLEVRGARGSFSFRRLDPATQAFRMAFREGATLGAACTRALAIDRDFDAGAALAAFLADGLATAVH